MNRKDEDIIYSGLLNVIYNLTEKKSCYVFNWRTTGTLKDRESIIGVQWGQGNPNPRVNLSSGKRGFAEFSTGTVDPKFGIFRFHCTPMIESISHIFNKKNFILYIWRDTVVYNWRRTVKNVTLEVTSDVLKLF